MRIAVAGKGGAGKSVIAGVLARLLARRGERVLAIDSDPIPGLALSLGLGPVDTPLLAAAAEQDEDGRWQLKKGIGAARAVQRFALTAPDGVRFLQFGKATAEGLAGAMGSLTALYRVVHRIARDRVLDGWSIVADLPAGPRHAAFDWAPYASTYLVVTEPTLKSILSARRIARIATSRPGVAALVVANKVRSPRDVSLIASRLQRDVVAAIPADDDVRAADRAGLSVLDAAPTCAAVQAIAELLEELDERVDRRSRAS
jgi:CO dehydrogenase maturation factor